MEVQVRVQMLGVKEMDFSGPLAADQPVVRIPSDADQRSEVIPIAIPNSCRSPFQSDGDHHSKLMPITFRQG